MRLKGTEAIAYAEKHVLTLCKYGDPIEGPREGLTVEEANDVAREDASLIYLELDESQARARAIARAREIYQDNDIRIDDDAEADLLKSGTWVQAWVWVEE